MSPKQQFWLAIVTLGIISVIASIIVNAIINLFTPFPLGIMLVLLPSCVIAWFIRRNW